MRTRIPLNIPTDTNKYWAEVKLFATGQIPGVASHSAAPAFSPDGKSVYFGTAPVKDITIMVSGFKKWQVDRTRNSPV